MNYETSVTTIEISQDTQAEIEDIAAVLSQAYGFDFPLELLEQCYTQVEDTERLRIIAERVRMRINIEPDDIFDEQKMARHIARLERAFQFYIDEYVAS